MTDSARYDAPADLPTVTDSPYLLRFGGSKYGLQILRQRAVAVNKKLLHNYTADGATDSRANSASRPFVFCE